MVTYLSPVIKLEYLATRIITTTINIFIEHEFHKLHEYDRAILTDDKFSLTDVLMKTSFYTHPTNKTFNPIKADLSLSSVRNN